MNLGHLGRHKIRRASHSSHPILHPLRGIRLLCHLNRQLLRSKTCPRAGAKIGDFESALLGYMRSECADVMQAIEADGGWDDDREAAFKSAIETFKSTQTW